MANKKAKVWNPIKWWTNNMTWLVTCCQLPLNTQISCNFYVHTINIWKNLLDRYLQFLMVVILPQTNIKTASYDGQHTKHPAHQQTVNFYDLIAFATAGQIACYRLLFGLRRDLYALMFCRNVCLFDASNIIYHVVYI